MDRVGTLRWLGALALACGVGTGDRLRAQAPSQGNAYLALMERAVAAYDDRFESYVVSNETYGVTEHGFPRLAANLGVLVANGRAAARKPVLRRMLDAACRDASKGPMANRGSGNEFSVRELVTAVSALARTKSFPADDIARWRADLARVVPRRDYTALPPLGDGRAYNWPLFGTAGEVLRHREGLNGDLAHAEAYGADQLRWFDEKGMYRDPGCPVVYDLVPRLMYAAMLHYGYDGPSRGALETLLEKSAEPTLRMLSACGEIPYGGRSNQFLHNHTLYAALCEWYAAWYARRGDMTRARRFRTAAKAAVDALEPWLAVEPVRHVKNRYPRGSGYGCEGYAYFDKYMATMGSWAMLAYELSAGSAITPEATTDVAPAVFVTSRDFHLVFQQAGPYSAQGDYDADAHYDADGLGRLHRRGAPAAICLSTPCTRTPSYRLEASNPCALALAPAADAKLVFTGAQVVGDAAVSDWTAGDLAWRCALSARGLAMTLTGPGAVALDLPAFAFDGETHHADRDRGEPASHPVCRLGLYLHDRRPHPGHGPRLRQPQRPLPPFPGLWRKDAPRERHDHGEVTSRGRTCRNARLWYTAFKALNERM